MKLHSTFVTLLSSILIVSACNQETKKIKEEITKNIIEIPIDFLEMNLAAKSEQYKKTILSNEIPGINVEHITISGDVIIQEEKDDRYRTIFLFVKGNGNLNSGDNRYEIVPETILTQNSVQSMSIQANEMDTLHYLRISSQLTEQDLLDLKEFPEENTQNIYFKKFTDCEAYTEPIKSPQTVSRTILPNKYIPRIAMGTVETKGPDKVDPHEHPMLEQLFLGLNENEVIVYADEAQVSFPPYSILHIPLGSSHSVEAKAGDKMYYVWMDFFKDKKGEEWLKTHNAIEDE